MVSAGKKTQSDAKKARLAAALRENLKRRKTQARAKAVAGTAGEAGDDPAGAAETADSRPNPAANQGQ